MANSNTNKTNTTSNRGRTASTRSTSSRNSNTGTGSNRTTSSRNNQASRKKAYEQLKRKKEEERRMKNIKILSGSVIFAVLLFLSNLNLVGTVGKYFSGIFFGFFGCLAYILPFVAILWAVFYIASQKDEALKSKISTGILIFADAGIIAEIVSGYTKNSVDGTYSFKDLWLYGYSDKLGGGIISGTIAFFMNRFLDTLATIVIAILLMLIFVYIIAGDSIIELYKNSKERLANQEDDYSDLDDYEDYETYDDEYEDSEKEPVLRKIKKSSTDRIREDRLQKKREAEKTKTAQEDETLLRMDMKRSGVSDDTEIGVSSKKKNDIHEIIINDVPDQEIEKEVVIAKDNIAFHLPEEEDAIPEEPVIEKEPVVKVNIVPPVMEEPAIAVRKDENVDVSRIKTQTESINESGSKNTKKSKIYKAPSLNLLEASSGKGGGNSKDELLATAQKLEMALESFGVKAKVTDISQGPSVTRYELEPAIGVKVNRITALADDLKLHLAAKDIRIEAPIPGKSAVGIEVPNSTSSGVKLKELIEDKEFKNFDGNIVFAVGKDIAGKVIVADISKMPHMLIAGSTGSGKSVCINTIIMSILYKHSPSDVQLILVDPKVVELNVYNDIPHLMIPVVTDPKKAAAALNWAVSEMTDRYKKFADAGVRDLKGYNQKAKEAEGNGDENAPKHLPQILIVVDELADLMMVAAKEVEESICRLAQLARACGIHLILATQRPSVDVITGLIKANMPSRVAFAVSSGIDSRTILDMNGAEKLLGKGDMLFFPQGYTKPARIQGAFVSDNEVADVVADVKYKNSNFDTGSNEKPDLSNIKTSNSSGGGSGDMDGTYDELLKPAGEFIIDSGKASIGMLQRKFRIGFNRAARIMDQLADAGVVGPEQGTKPRDILMSHEQFEQFIDEEYV